MVLEELLGIWKLLILKRKIPAAARTGHSKRAFNKTTAFMTSRSYKSWDLQGLWSRNIHTQSIRHSFFFFFGRMGTSIFPVSLEFNQIKGWIVLRRDHRVFVKCVTSALANYHHHLPQHTHTCTLFLGQFQPQIHQTVKKSNLWIRIVTIVCSSPYPVGNFWHGIQTLKRRRGKKLSRLG